MRKRSILLLNFSALFLLILVIAGLARLPAVQRQELWIAFRSLVAWLPVLYGVVAISYAGRYLRWRMLLNVLDIGNFSWSELLLWFRGFALTATPAKVGELSRIQLLHERLGYPRLPLVHVFAAERCSDLLAVFSLLLILAPAQIFEVFSRVTSSSVYVVIFVSAIIALSICCTPLSARLSQWWKQQRHRLPSGALGSAMLPASIVSLLVWANESLVLWLLVKVLTSNSISISAAVVIYLVSGTAGMASSLPGGIGVNEGATVLLLAQQGVSVTVALPIAVLRRLITLWSMVALAALAGAFPLNSWRSSRAGF